MANIAGRLEGVKVTSLRPVEHAFGLPMSLEESQCWYLRSEIFGELIGIGRGQSEWIRQDILGGPGQQIFIS